MTKPRRSFPTSVLLKTTPLSFPWLSSTLPRLFILRPAYYFFTSVTHSNFSPSLHTLPTFHYSTQRTYTHSHSHCHYRHTPPNEPSFLFVSSMSPRSARPVLLATLALGLVGFLCWGPSLGGSTSYYRDLYDGWHSPGQPRPPTLSERLRGEEARYTETLKGRQWLIEKHGPRKEQVQS
jgi:hypothetical protein